jgi:transposase-like protein
VFGVITSEYQPARGYYTVVHRRNRANLLPILRQCLKPGSIVHTDDWGAYDQLERYLPQHVARHRVVNHTLNFVDPVTGVHTQDIESKWNQLKQKLKERRGINRDDLQSYLNERMWREWKGSGDELLENVFTSINLMYPLNVPV